MKGEWVGEVFIGREVGVAADHHRCRLVLANWGDPVPFEGARPDLFHGQLKITKHSEN